MAYYAAVTGGVWLDNKEMVVRRPVMLGGEFETSLAAVGRDFPPEALLPSSSLLAAAVLAPTVLDTAATAMEYRSLHFTSLHSRCLPAVHVSQHVNILAVHVISRLEDTRLALHPDLKPSSSLQRVHNRGLQSRQQPWTTSSCLASVGRASALC